MFLVYRDIETMCICESLELAKEAVEVIDSLKDSEDPKAIILVPIDGEYIKAKIAIAFDEGYNEGRGG